MVATLRLQGVHAPTQFNGPMDALTVRAYVQQVLISTVRSSDVMVLDNLAVHRDPVPIPRSRRPGPSCDLLPTYSPDFNSIEMAFAKLKAFLRAARPRSFDQSASGSPSPSHSSRPTSAPTTSSIAAIVCLQEYRKRF